MFDNSWIADAIAFAALLTQWVKLRKDHRENGDPDS